MRDYMIAHYPTDNERAIMRVSEDDVQRLNSKDEWTREKKRARRFFHKDTAEGALVVCKMKAKIGKDVEERPPVPQQIKTTWSSC